MPSLTRGLRHMLQYATSNGTEPSRVHRKRAADVAPILQQRQQKRPRLGINSTGDDVDAKENNGAGSPPPSSRLFNADVMEHLRSKKYFESARLGGNALRIIQALGAAPAGHNDFSVLRIAALTRADVYTMLAIAALQRRSNTDSSGHRGSLLLITSNDAEAAELATHMCKSGGLDHILLLDESTVRFPTFPVAVQNGDGHASLVDRTALVIASLSSFLLVDARSAIWKFIGAYAVLTSPRGPSGKRAQAAANKPEKLEALCRQRWRCLGQANAAAIIALIPDTPLAPFTDALTTRPPLASEPSSQTTAADSSHDDNNSAAVSLRQPVTVHYAVVEGTHRLQMLYAAVMSLRAGQGLVVHFATREACRFVHDILYALGELPASLLLLSDSEATNTQANAHEGEADRQRLCKSFDQTVSSHAESPQKDRVVLLSAYGLVPQRGTVFVQYDVMVDLVNFAQFVSDVLTPAAYKKEAIDPAMRRHARSPPPATTTTTNSSGAKRSVSRTRSTPPETVTKAMYRHVIVLLRRNELKAALPLLQTPAGRLQISFEPVPKLPSATLHLLAMQKVKSLHKKQFAVQNAAYAAYRATMLLYSLMGPRNVYDERQADLVKVAEEFGYEQPPILDLRTRDTEYRPKEDIYRAAREQAMAEQRRLKAFVAANIVGEAPEEHIPDEE